MMNDLRKRVLLIGSDGLRPDLFDPSLMPACTRLVKQGTWFQQHHAVYPSKTRVQMTTLTTGALPGRHGVVDNSFFVPGTGMDGFSNTGKQEHVFGFESNTGEPFVLAPTLGDRIRGLDGQLGVVGAGSPGAALLWNVRHPEHVMHPDVPWEFAAFPERASLPKLETEPDRGKKNRCRWATEVMLRLLRDHDEHPVLVLWLSEPDASFHAYGAGSPEGREALRTVDACVGLTLDALERSGQRDNFNVFLLSDHGHTTYAPQPKLKDLLQEAEGDIPELSNFLAGEHFLYPSDKTSMRAEDNGALARFAEKLLSQPWCDVMFAHGMDPAEEVFAKSIPLADVFGPIDHHRAPLLGVSPRWSHRPNAFGVPGIVEALVGPSPESVSGHGSLCPYDMHALCAASGPDFRENHVSEIPTSAIDIAPTVMHLIGAAAEPDFQGRVLVEGFRTEGLPEPEVGFHELRPEKHAGDDERSCPAIRMARVNGSPCILGSKNASTE